MAGRVSGWLAGEVDNNTSSGPAGLWLKLQLSLTTFEWKEPIVKKYIKKIQVSNDQKIKNAEAKPLPTCSYKKNKVVELNKNRCCFD